MNLLTRSTKFYGYLKFFLKPNSNKGFFLWRLLLLLFLDLILLLSIDKRHRYLSNDILMILIY